jgi:3-dehydroquinate dehydratase-2
MLPKTLILNGPNLNLLGVRQPAVYGPRSLADVEAACVRRAAELGLAVDFRQSNSEGQLIDWLQQARGVCAAVIINAGAYTHTSIAILDALLALDMPIFEVHISNIFQREAFRNHSYVSQAASGVLCGFGTFGYELALIAAAQALRPASPDQMSETPT